MPKVFWTYILHCANGQYYVGSTDNLKLRMQEHQGDLDNPEFCRRGALFTKAHRPVELVYFEEYNTREEAYAREKQLKGWSRAKKEALIKGKFDLLHDLSKKHGR